MITDKTVKPITPLAFILLALYVVTLLLSEDAFLGFRLCLYPRLYVYAAFAGFRRGKFGE